MLISAVEDANRTPRNVLPVTLLAIHSFHLIRTAPLPNVGVVMRYSDGNRVQVAPNTLPNMHWFRDDPDTLYACCNTIEGKLWAGTTIPADLL